MNLYCDRLDVHALLPLASVRMRCRGRILLRLLDAPKRTRQEKVCAAVLRLFRFELREAKFFAGALKTREGKSAFLVARQTAMEWSFSAAQDVLRRSRLLSSLNSRWSRNTILLHLSKQFWRPTEEMIVRVLVSSLLSGDEQCELILHRLAGVSRLPEMPANVSVTLCGGDNQRAEIFRNVIFVASRLWRVLSQRNAGVAPAANKEVSSSPSGQAVLTIQDDDLNTDPSYRCHPHWLYAPAEPWTPRIYVLAMNPALYSSHNAADLSRRGIEVLSSAALLSSWKSILSTSNRPLLGDFLKCLAGSIVAMHRDCGTALWNVGLLLARASALGDLCARYRVGVFVTSENHSPESDAMQIVAGMRSVRTVSYQSATLGIVNPLMMTTADEMLTFSPAFDRLVKRDDIKPGSTRDIGYPLDTFFPSVRKRAMETREQLSAAGARFVICYFDEDIKAGKYALLGLDDHYREFNQLLRYVLQDPTTGLIVKTKFNRSLPTKLFPNDPEVRAAVKTGRYVELTAGLNRNSVLAAEAALSSDFCLGHSIGATAVLEGALVGKRGVLLNSSGFESMHDPVFSRANVVVATMDEALSAITLFRTGAGARTVGDWSQIVGEFDRYRDGQAAVRLKERIRAVSSTTSAAREVSREAVGITS